MGKITILELQDPVPPEMHTWWQLLKGILIMTFCVLCLTVSGILVKYHYEYNPQVTIYDMVFTRAFSQLLISFFIAMRNNVDLTNLTE